MLSPDLLTAPEIGAADVHECGVLVEQARERVHVMLVPRAGEGRRKSACDIRLAHLDADLPPQATSIRHARA